MSAVPLSALILVDHGSRLEEANQLLDQLAERFRQRKTYAIVETAHMELVAPTLADAFGRCVAQGARRIVVVPYFLAPGRHSSRDIPSLAAEAAEGHAGVQWTVAAPLGLDDRLLDVVETRAREALSRL